MLWYTIAFILIAAFIFLSIVALIKKPKSIYAKQPLEKNKFEGKKVVFVFNSEDKCNADGVRGHLEDDGVSCYRPSFYEKYVKRAFDIIGAFFGLLLLSPVFLAIIIAIEIDDPGPPFFSQKRLGQNKQYFCLYKFRSMKLSAPHDVPTHRLDNPDQYITSVGKFCRAHSLDELPQIWNIFLGNMSIVGPRPALWNQDLLTAERDRYGANDIKPGLTGLAQIKGRDQLSIEEKAKLDGEYAEKVSFWLDLKCILGSLHVFKKDDTVVEGGTGSIAKSNEKAAK